MKPSGRLRGKSLNHREEGIVRKMEELSFNISNLPHTHTFVQPFECRLFVAHLLNLAILDEGRARDKGLGASLCLIKG